LSNDCSISLYLTPSPSPTNASLVGEELQCGKHGYSARDYGFRFDIDVDVGDMGSVGGRSDRSERCAGDCHVYPRKDEKDRVLEKDREKDKEKDEEGKNVNREKVVEPAPPPAIQIEIPCDEMMRECIFVPIPIPLPIPIHPHAGDPLLVEDPGTVTERLLLFPILFFLYLFLFLLLLLFFLYSFFTLSSSFLCMCMQISPYPFLALQSSPTLHLSLLFSYH
jgi:hypothetical protein